jgi:CelD/BcsL family acetyltransferase involved in cellulose biosynthesis
LADQGQCIALQRYWLDDDEDFHLSTHSLKGRWIRRAANESGYLEIPTDRPDARASLSPRRRYDLRRANRRARDMGGLNYSIAIPTSENASSLLDLAATIEDKSWKGRAKSSIRSNKKMLEFLQLYTRECVPSKVMRFLFLYIGNEPASMAICAQSRTALWFLKIGYDERFSSCSPGLLLLVKATQYCIEEGLTRIEHLGADEPWLSPWTTGVRRYANVRYYPQSLNGIIAFSHDTIRFGLSRATRLLKLWRSSLRSSQHSIVRSS